MDRITFEGNFCDIAMCRENPCPYNGMCSQRQTWERLKEYEDTGLDPEEIKDSIGWMSPVCVQCDGKTSNGIRTEKCGYPDNITKCLEQSKHLGENCLFLHDDFTCHDYGKTWLAYRQKPEEGTV